MLVRIKQFLMFVCLSVTGLQIDLTRLRAGGGGCRGGELVKATANWPSEGRSTERRFRCCTQRWQRPIDAPVEVRAPPQTKEGARVDRNAPPPNSPRDPWRCQKRAWSKWAEPDTKLAIMARNGGAVVHAKFSSTDKRIIQQLGSREIIAPEADTMGKFAARGRGVDIDL